MFFSTDWVNKLMQVFLQYFHLLLCYTATKEAINGHCDRLCSLRNATNYYYSITAIEVILRDQKEIVVTLCWKGPVVNIAKYLNSWTVAEAMKPQQALQGRSVLQGAVRWWRSIKFCSGRIWKAQEMYQNMKGLTKVPHYLLKRNMLSVHLVLPPFS